MKKLSSLFNKGKEDNMKKISGIDNEYFFRGDFNEKFSNLNEVEVENLVAYIMRN